MTATCVPVLLRTVKLCAPRLLNSIVCPGAALSAAGRRMLSPAVAGVTSMILAARLSLAEVSSGQLSVMSALSATAA